jgi:hypothetical protein
LAAQDQQQYRNTADWPSAVEGLAPDQQIEALSAQAERCLRLASATYNREVSEILGTMGEEYQRSAEQLSRSHNS